MNEDNFIYRLGELAVVVNANPCPLWERGVFVFEHGDELRLAYDSDAVLASNLNLEEMLRECLE